MSYSAEISRANPACFLFLVDQSNSMHGGIGGLGGLAKKDQAADAVNRIVDTLSQRCSSGMQVRDYFHVGILGYTSEGRIINGDKPEITSALTGTAPERPFLPISQVVEVAEIEEKRVKENYGGGEIVEVTRRMPVWLRPRAAKRTPLSGTLRLVKSLLVEWISDHPDSYPPIVIIVCDGSSTDGDPWKEAEQIKTLRTSDGNVLLFTVHLSGSRASPIQFPSREQDLPSASLLEDPRLLFRISSVLPEGSRRQAVSLGFPVNETSRGFVFNADSVALAQFLDIGTRGPSNLH